MNYDLESVLYGLLIGGLLVGLVWSAISAYYHDKKVDKQRRQIYCGLKAVHARLNGLGGQVYQIAKDIQDIKGENK